MHTLKLLPLLSGFLLWLPSLNQPLQAKTPTLPVTSTPSPTPITNPNPVPIETITEEVKKQLPKEVEKQLTEEVKKKLSEQVKMQQLEEMNKHSDNLLITVYLSLLSTVVTIVIFVLGTNWLSNVVQRDTEKKQIRDEVKAEVRLEIIQILESEVQIITEKNRKQLTEILKEINAAKIYLKLMESELARISAEHMSSEIERLNEEKIKNKIIHKYPKAIQEHIRSLLIIHEIKTNNRSLSNENPAGIFYYGLDAVNDLIIFFQNNKDIQPYFTLEQIQDIEKMLKTINSEEYKSIIQNIQDFLETFKLDVLSKN